MDGGQDTTYTDDKEGSIDLPENVSGSTIDIQDSILNSVKKMLGIEPEITDFDDGIMIHINSAIFHLNELGIGPDEIYVVTNGENTYQDFLGDQIKYKSIVSQYLYFKAYIAFDHTLTSNVVKTVSDSTVELESRILYMLERDEAKGVKT